MPLSHLSVETLEAQADRLLAEIASRRHAAGCACTEAPPPDQAGWERATLAHWLALRPDMDSVTVIVRSYGKPVVTMCLEPDAVPCATTCGASGGLRPPA